MAFQRWKKKKRKENARKAIRSEPSKRETRGIRSRRPIPDTWHFRRGLKFRIFIRIRAEYRVWCSREGTVLLVDKSIGQRRAWRAWNPSRKWNFLEWAPPRAFNRFAKTKCSWASRQKCSPAPHFHVTWNTRWS